MQLRGTPRTASHRRLGELAQTRAIFCGRAAAHPWFGLDSTEKATRRRTHVGIDVAARAWAHSTLAETTARAPRNIPRHRAVARRRRHTVSPLLGAAKGALDVVGPLMTAERPVFGTTYRRRTESPSARRTCADASQLVRIAEQRTLGVADVLDTAERGRPVPPVEFAHARMQLMAAVQDCRLAVEELLDLDGSSAFPSGNPPGRFWRDLAVGGTPRSTHGWPPTTTPTSSPTTAMTPPPDTDGSD